MSLRAVREHVLLKVVAAPTQTQGGLFLPQTAAHSPSNQGSVVSVGEGVPSDLALEPSQLVVFEPAKASSKTVLNGEPHFSVHHKYILAVLS